MAQYRFRSSHENSFMPNNLQFANASTHFLIIFPCEDMASSTLHMQHHSLVSLSSMLEKIRGRNIATSQGRQVREADCHEKRVLAVFTEIVLGRTIIWTLQKCQIPKTRYEQPVQWRCSSSCHRLKYQSWHHNVRTLWAQVKEPGFGPNTH